jgi:hypothetical protein
MPILGMVYNLEHYTSGAKQSTILNMMIEATMMMDKSDMNEVILYKNIDACFVCYNLLTPIIKIRSENECCAKFLYNGIENEICSTRPVSTC